MISGGIFDVAHKQSSLEDINNKLSEESTWSNLELSQSLNKEKADLEKFLNSFVSVDEAINDNLEFLDIAIEESDDDSIEEINEETGEKEKVRRYFTVFNVKDVERVIQENKLIKEAA